MSGLRIITNAARALKLRAARKCPARRRLPALVLLTDRARLADPRPVLARLPRGSAVILREYHAGMGDRASAREARALARTCRARGLKLIVAGDLRLALAIGADGLHLPEWMVRRAGLGARPGRRRPGLLLTAACHSLPALRAAVRLGADAALLAPVLATASHPGAVTLGPLRFARLVRCCPIAVYALGGMDGAGARRIAGSGAAGIAGIGFVTVPES